MKSMGLALTIFALTGTLAALDLSGAHHVHATTQTVVRSANASSVTIASATGKTEEEEVGDDEGDGELVNTFLVTPRQVRAVNNAAALRYD